MMFFVSSPAILLSINGFEICQAHRIREAKPRSFSPKGYVAQEWRAQGKWMKLGVVIKRSLKRLSNNAEGESARL